MISCTSSYGLCLYYQTKETGERDFIQNGALIKPNYAYDAASFFWKRFLHVVGLQTELRTIGKSLQESRTVQNLVF